MSRDLNRRFAWPERNRRPLNLPKNKSSILAIAISQAYNMILISRLKPLLVSSKKVPVFENDTSHICCERQCSYSNGYTGRSSRQLSTRMSEKQLAVVNMTIDAEVGNVACSFTRVLAVTLYRVDVLNGFIIIFHDPT